MPAYKVDTVAGGTTPGAGQVRFLRFHPYGVGLDANATTNCYNPAAGGCAGGTDANALHAAGSVWTVPATVTANAAPAAGRVLLGTVQVRTDTNVLVGSGDVIIQAVTP